MKMYALLATLLTAAALLLVTTGCTRHEVELKPVEIKPIHITLDINIRVERALDDFFSEIDAAQAKQ